MYEVSSAGRLNMVDITIENFHKRILQRFKRNNVTLPMLVLGPVGIGKTAGIIELVKENGLGFRSLRLANMQETDLIGLPKIVASKSPAFTQEEVEAGKNLVVNWVQQGFLPDPHNPDFKENGILFLDEISNCNRDVQAAAWQLMDSSRSIGDYNLPDGWLIVAAGNGPEDGGNYHPLSSALLGRCEAYRMMVDFDSWRNWAINHDIHPVVIAYLNMYKDSLWKWNPLEAEAEGEKFPQPRVWEEASKNLQYAEAEQGGAVSYSDAIMEVGGWLGERETKQFASFYVLKDEMIPLEDIAEGKPHKDISQLRREVQYIQVESMARFLIEQMKRTDAEGYKRTINVMKFLMELAKSSVDIWLTVLQEIGKSKDVSVFMTYCLTKSADINRDLPEWSRFYTTNKALISG